MGATAVSGTVAVIGATGVSEDGIELGVHEIGLLGSVDNVDDTLNCDPEDHIGRMVRIDGGEALVGGAGALVVVVAAQRFRRTAAGNRR